MKNTENKKNTKNTREWDFCDQCIFYVSCLREEKKRGDGCEAFSPYPYELNAVINEEMLFQQTGKVKK
jgi:hypothetical protein